MCYKSSGYKTDLSKKAWVVIEPLLKRGWSRQANEVGLASGSERDFVCITKWLAMGVSAT